MADPEALTDKEGNVKHFPEERAGEDPGRGGGLDDWGPGAREECARAGLPGSQSQKPLSQEIGEAVEGF